MAGMTTKFKSGDPAKRAAAIVKAVANDDNPAVPAELSGDPGEAMAGINEQEIKIFMAERGKQAYSFAERLFAALHGSYWRIFV